MSTRLRTKSEIAVDVADMKVSNDPSATIVTHALGSCIGLTIYDPVAKVGGMLHYMLPEGRLSPDRARENPYMFADTGVPALFRKAYELGAVKRRLIAKAAGGAELLDGKGSFEIGKRNFLMLRKLFWKNDVLLSAEDVGGRTYRTLRLSLETGRVWVTAAGKGSWDL